jgi:hypothetical protein
MATDRLAGRLCPLAFLLALAGCHTLQRSRPVTILTRDAETKRPIAQAEVKVMYPLERSAFSPQDTYGQTGGDGLAHVWATPTEEVGVMIDVRAGGYLPAEKGLTVAALRAIEPAGLFEAVDRRPVTLVAELYAEPGPTVELVVPAGYRGMVRAQIDGRDEVPCPPGQRLFRYDVSASGQVQAQGPPLLKDLAVTDFRLSYADGAPLSHHAKESPVGYWWVRSEGANQCFLVGTQAEYDALRKSEQEERRENQKAGGGRGSGHGRRNRGAGQAPADSAAPGMGP